MLELEEEGKVNLSVRMKKKALQGALEAAAKKKKVGPRSAVVCRRPEAMWSVGAPLLNLSSGST